MFISRDPNILKPPANSIAYAPNPVVWVDPFGLNRKYVNLGQGYKGGIDTFDTKGQFNFEIHVFDKKGKEVGMYGPKGWFNKHGLTGRPAGIPVEVENQCKGHAVDIGRRQGLIPEKGRANIKGNRWKKFLSKVWLIGPLIEMTKPSPERACDINPNFPELCQ